MTRIDDLSQKYDLKNWPHRFTKDGDPRVVDKDPQTGDPIMVAPMICVDCGARYLNGKESRPPDPCPARNQKTEMKRLLS